MKTLANTRSCFLRLLVAAILGSASTHLPASDWPQWRGPNRDAKAADFKLPQTWPKELTRKWQVTVGEGVATPALVGDKLYVFSRQDGNEATRCLEAATGKELWQDKYDSLGATGPASGFSGPRSSPAVAAGKVVTLGVRGMVSCLDAATGQKIWRKDDFQAWPNFFPSSSPMIVGGLVIAQLGGRDNGALVAYDLESGEQKWKWSGESPGYASPVLMTVDGAELIIAETDRRIVAVRTEDGKLVWETPYAVQGRGYNASTPLAEEQTLIFSGSGRGVKAIKITKEGGAYSGQELWSNPEKSVQFNTPVLKNGFVYGLTQANEFFCLNAETGQSAWSAPAARPSEAGPAESGGRRGRGGGGGGYGSIVDAGPVLLALTPSSELIVVQPDPKAYQELARFKVAQSPTHAYPVVSGNRIFIKDRDSVTLWSIE